MSITEDYVSLEVAKMLKEKGFNERSIASYDSKGQLQEGYGYWNKTPIWCAAPTHQMAMKWLREEYKIAINIRIACKKTISYIFDIWDFEIIHPNEFVGGTIDLREQQFDFKSYEEAVEAALKYSLENLI
jgi:hypothetical protein